MIQNLNLIESFKNLKKMVQQHWQITLLAYTLIVSLSALSDWISRSSYFGFFSLILPLFLSLLSFCIVWTFAFFILPYFFQRYVNQKKHDNLRSLSFKFFCKKKISLWTKETCRVFLHSYAFAFLFIVPGLIYFLKSSFVSYIVLFGKAQNSYQKISSQMSKGRMSQLSFLWFVFIGMFFILDFSGTYINQLFELKTNLLSAIIKDAWLLGYSCFLSLHLHSIQISTLPARKPSLQPISELSL